MSKTIGKFRSQAGVIGNHMVQHDDQVYHSFLLRCRLMPRSLSSEPVVWRFELKEVTAEHNTFRFGDLDQMRAFLDLKLEAVAKGVRLNGDIEGGGVMIK
jgi:hypothetical protein